jgi:carbon-monoxide dehydrogenase medium subunit
MKPAAFDYVRPSSVEEAVRVLAATPDAKVLAGGQTLGPMLNLRLAQPPVLVDITRIPELAQVEEDAASVTIGATVTHAAVEDGRVSDPAGGFLARVAHGIAYRAVRTRGTIGGSLAHADPAADWLACLTALRAEVVIAGPGGRRIVALPRFVRGAMETGLESGELLVAARIPRPSRGTRFGFHKICRRAGEFADAIGVVVADPERTHVCVAAGAAMGRPLAMISDTVREDRIKTRDDARTLLVRALAGTGGAPDDPYGVALNAAALKRAYDEAFAA